MNKEMSHGHTNHELRWSADDEATTDKATNVELEAMRAKKSRTWERWDEDLKMLGTTQENEDKDNDQGDKMGRNENTRLMCQWLVLNPLKGTKEVTSIYMFVGYM